MRRRVLEQELRVIEDLKSRKVDVIGSEMSELSVEIQKRMGELREMEIPDESRRQEIEKQLSVIGQSLE